MVHVKNIFGILPFVLLLSLMSCQEKIFTDSSDCDVCYEEKPDSIDIEINITLKNSNDEIPVLLYEGYVDNGTLIDTFFCFGTPVYILVKEGKVYSAKALYTKTGKTTYVIDGTKPKLKSVSETCETDCWVVQNNTLNLVLKYNTD